MGRAAVRVIQVSSVPAMVTVSEYCKMPAFDGADRSCYSVATIGIDPLGTPVAERLSVLKAGHAPVSSTRSTP